MSIGRFSVDNPVLANLLMALIVALGMGSLFTLNREFLPNTDIEMVMITARYPGASPMEVEKSVTVKLEAAIQGVDGIKKIDSRVSEGSTALYITTHDAADVLKVRRDLESAIQLIDDMPDIVEDIAVRELRPRIPMISIVAHGNISEKKLRSAIDAVRDDLLLSPEISEIQISGAREPEISISIDPDKLEKFGLTFAQVAGKVRQWNYDLPGGEIKTGRGNIRLRTLGESDSAERIAAIPIVTSRGGASVTLGQLAEVVDGFEESQHKGWFQGEPAVVAVINKTPEQDAIRIAETAREYVENFNRRGDVGYRLDIQNDRAGFIEDRIDLMAHSAYWGLGLVFLAMAILLDFRVAFWAAIGLPVSFFGAFFLMKLMGMTINLYSLFGLIVVLGMLVDDAIIVGEHVFYLRQKGLSPREAAIQGTNTMVKPVTAAVLTTIAAFFPLTYVSGMSRYMAEVPMVVIAALSVSLFEAFVILPSHLAEFLGATRAEKMSSARSGLLHRFSAARSFLRAKLFDVWMINIYGRLLQFALQWRYAFTAAFVGLAIYTVGLPRSGKLPFEMFYKTDTDHFYLNLEMEAGTPFEDTERTMKEIEEIVMANPAVSSVYTTAGGMLSSRRSQGPLDPEATGQLMAEMAPAEERKTGATQVIDDLRRKIGKPPGVSSVQFRIPGPRSRDETAPFEIQVRGEDMEQMAAAVADIKAELSSYAGVVDIEDDLEMGKVEAKVTLKPSAANLGLDVGSLAAQLRGGFFGVKVQTLQRGTEEVEVWVRLKRDARKSLADLENMRIATPNGGRVPFGEVAELKTGLGYGTLSRLDGKRTITVSADVEEGQANVYKVTQSLRENLEASIPRSYPALTIFFGGEEAERKESMAALFWDFGLALLLIYIIIAVVFHSYVKPLVVMAAIPFSMVGAVLGHYWTGWSIGMMSLLGMTALAGIVVNDSIVLVDFVQRYMAEGRTVYQSVLSAGKRRLRAILLTSITTILGLLPLMLEQSVQAKFLIPMAVSIVWGLMFATVLTLILLPCLYLIHEDIRSVMRWGWTGAWRSIHEERPDVVAAYRHAESD